VISARTRDRLTIGFALAVALVAYTVLVWSFAVGGQQTLVVHALDREAYAIGLAKDAHERAAGRLGLERDSLRACLAEARQ